MLKAAVLYYAFDTGRKNKSIHVNSMDYTLMTAF